VDREAAKRGDTPALGHEVVAVAWSGKEKGGAWVDRASREAEAKEEWRWPGCLGRLARKGEPRQFSYSG
jgi:hypothetical protein